MNRRGFVFLREARAAASVRHPNVASVFHLGRTGENYFYVRTIGASAVASCQGMMTRRVMWPLLSQ
jgi:hypothetical protein